MALSKEEIEPGIIAILEPEILLADRRIKYLGTESFRAGPFLCVQVVRTVSLWLSITRQPGAYSSRVELRKKWRRDGEPHWHDGGSYINNVGMPFIGPLESFVNAGRRESPYTQYARPSVSVEGVEAIIGAMVKRGVPILDELPNRQDGKR